MVSARTKNDTLVALLTAVAVLRVTALDAELPQEVAARAVAIVEGAVPRPVGRTVAAMVREACLASAGRTRAVMPVALVLMLIGLVELAEEDA